MKRRIELSFHDCDQYVQLDMMPGLDQSSVSNHDTFCKMLDLANPVYNMLVLRGWLKLKKIFFLNLNLTHPFEHMIYWKRKKFINFIIQFVLTSVISYQCFQTFDILTQARNHANANTQVFPHRFEK